MGMFIDSFAVPLLGLRSWVGGCVYFSTKLSLKGGWLLCTMPWPFSARLEETPPDTYLTATRFGARVDWLGRGGTPPPWVVVAAPAIYKV